MGWTALEPRGRGEGSESKSYEEGMLPEELVFLPGSGVARMLYSQWLVKWQMFASPLSTLHVIVTDSFDSIDLTVDFNP